MSASLPFRRQALVLLAVIATGFATGFLIRPHPIKPASATAGPQMKEATRSRHAVSQEPTHSPQSTAPTPTVFSTDTIPTLLALHPGDLYPRLALWLIDATSPEIDALFRKLMDHFGAQPRHFELLFTRWAATDPLAAIAAAKGTAHAHLPWSGWAKNQPLEAFRHAMEHDPSMVATVIGSIASSDPDLARSLLAQHPELPQNLADRALIPVLARRDPKAALDLALEIRSNDFRPLETWLREDPRSAYEWFLKNRRFYPKGESPDDAVLESLSRENPAVLAELVDTTPPGKFRRSLEDLVFQQLLATNPEKALAEARKNPSPLIVSQRLAQIGVFKFQKDPDAARAILSEILASNPDPANRGTSYQLGPSSTTSSSISSEISEFLTILTRQNPQATLTEVLVTSESWNVSARVVAGTWIQEDPAALAAWARQQPGPSTRRHAAEALVGNLASPGNYREGLSYLDVAPETDRAAIASSIVAFWNLQDPEAARAWAEEVGMLEPLKEVLQQE